MQPFTATVIKIIKEIPKGRVMSYGQIATYAGSPRGARQVVRILHSMSHKYGLPWHRVVNKVGEIRLNDCHQADMQKELLEQEGVFFIQAHQVDMSRSQYDRAK
ncbi:MGMT family protein [Cytobacillus sp. OWB-43]|uniref:MGMT family protein n=1 Tax=Cytobacillus sp. OWB-43 TaxID=3108468 RepID=UPI002AFE2DD5|nr:MGMT family protein [Cytobacillus sp. OWB-43]MEA1852408.1 MGMT family protein [Cytobacillus sp. OWB-43]